MMDIFLGHFHTFCKFHLKFLEFDNRIGKKFTIYNFYNSLHLYHVSCDIDKHQNTIIKMF